MNRLFSLPIIIFLQFLLLTSFVDAQEIPTGEIVGSYISATEFTGSIVKVNADGTYTIDSGSHDGTGAFNSGKYSVEGNVINFNKLYEKRTGIERDEFKSEELPKNKQGKFYIEEKYEENTNVSKMILVKWQNRLYMIPEDELKNFCNAVNLGLEPRLLTASEPYFGTFYLRKNDEFKDVTGFPEVPLEWKSFLLKTPVMAKIISIENKNIVVINKGTENSLKVGTHLIKEGIEPLIWSGFEVLFVEKYSARLRINRNSAKVGDTLTTKFERSEDDKLLQNWKREQMKKYQKN